MATGYETHHVSDWSLYQMSILNQSCYKDPSKKQTRDWQTEQDLLITVLKKNIVLMSDQGFHQCSPKCKANYILIPELLYEVSMSSLTRATRRSTKRNWQLSQASIPALWKYTNDLNHYLCGCLCESNLKYIFTFYAFRRHFITMHVSWESNPWPLR